MNLDFQRLERLLAEAAAKNDPAERAAYLDQACGNELDLRAEVERLLAAHEKAGDFLETPIGPAGNAECGVRNSDSSGLAAGSESGNGMECAGATIGRYKLLEEIGEGAFGVVYMAEQLEPVHRQVALKIIKPGMDTREVVARFEAERQALARMDHPNIAQIFDAGVTGVSLTPSLSPTGGEGVRRTGEGVPAGRPYFVMELVRGVSITEFCDQRNLSTKERLQLFIQVCHAVQHAHQKGIIHRDLKPSNILVTLVDGEPLPKIIDFGVAKALGQKLTERTLFTGFLKMVGTPAYMSPEQADLSGVDIDTRADIYALGVLLYELLTGITPFSGDTLRKAALDEIRRLIREIEPPKPSTRLQALAAADVRRLKSTGTRQPTEEEIRVSSRRLLQIKENIRLVRGDLDWIVMKCLEKDRRRRYETADSLASDIGRHFDHQPVSASPPGTIYRVCKFLRRHRMGVALGASVGAALVLGLVFALVGFAQAERERDHALKAEQQAQMEAVRSAQVAQFMQDMLEGVGPSVALGRDTAMLRQILDRTAERVGEDLNEQPQVEAELRETLGNIYRDIGLYTNAEAMLREAVELRKQLTGDEDLAVASVLHNLAEVFWQQRRNVEAETAYRKALAIRRRLLGNEHADVAASLFGLAETLRRKETPSVLAEAESLHREALAMRRKLLGPDHPAVASSLTGLAIVLQKEGSSEAVACYREAVDIQRKQLGNQHPTLAYTLCNLGLNLAGHGKPVEGEKAVREALAIQQKVLGEHRDTAYTLNFLGSILVMQGRPSEGEQMHREALAMQRKVLGEHTDEGVSLEYLGEALRAQGRLAEAEAAFREALALRRRLIGEEHPYTLDTLLELIDVLCAQEKYAGAEPLLVSGYERMKQRENNTAHSGGPRREKMRRRIVQLYEAWGKLDQAAQWRQKLAEEENTTTPKQPGIQ